MSRLQANICLLVVTILWSSEVIIFSVIPGCLAFAAGNLIVDIATDSLRLSSIAGFVGSFVCPYLMYLFWTQLRKQEFNLRTGRTLAPFCLRSPS